MEPNEQELDQQVQEEQQVDNNQDANVEQPGEGTPHETTDSEQEPEFTLDDEGNLTWNDSDDDNSTEESDEGQPEDSGLETEETQDNNPRYKVKVDGKEVEVSLEELTKGYMRQADYTRKTQELAERRKQVQNLQRIPQAPMNPMAGQQQTSANLNALAKQIAAKNLGLSSTDDLSELDFDHQAAFIEAKQNLLNQRNFVMNRQRAMLNLENQLRAEDPAYDDIMANAKSKMESLPYKQFKALQDAYAQGNPEPLRKFYHEVLQKEHYAKAIEKVNKSKKTVPKIEASGNTPLQTNKNKRIDFRQLGTMNQEQKAQFLIDNGFI
jgi:hypothetical protein